MKRHPALNKALTAMGVAAAAGLVVAAFPTHAEASDQLTIQESDEQDVFESAASYENLPMEISLTGKVRDFRERTVDGGHPDFERRPDGGFGHYMGNVAESLDEDGKPFFVGGGGKVKSQWKDASGNPIHPSLYDASLGDLPGDMGSSDSGGISSEASFRQWFRDVPGINAGKPLTITLTRNEGSSVYTFDDTQSEQFSGLGGFFPINGDLFGNSPGDDKNFHFTFELQTEFTYDADAAQIFRFIGDDDVWVYIDGRLVIDIGGVHSKVSQTVDLSRLDWLEDGETYSLHFFFAERHRTQSNFRIETTLNLRNGKLPTTAGMFD